MAKNKFDFKAVEEKWKKFWEKEKIYKFDFKNSKRVFSIDTPPPYISGKMHIGHAFSYSQQDFIARFMRMFLSNKGGVFYPFGTDDNGLPTERFIEKINKVKSKDMGRAEFIELCLRILKKEIPNCLDDFKKLGISSDYEVYYSTIDKHSQEMSQKSFIELYKKGEIYKTAFPTLWCPECRTSIAQAELEDKDENSLFSTLKFSCENKDLLIATTRPELLNACVAVFVNPKDNRYKSLVGKSVRVPLFDFEVPIIEDSSAEIDKGTGVLMICSYGDRFDVDAINRHGLKPKIIFDEKGEMIEGRYKGLKVKEARKKILEDLKKANLLLSQKEIGHIVNVHDKCGTGIEFIETEQWFTKILDKKKELISQGNKINWYPEFMKKRYENWVNGLEWDWSISRNRHFGVPIPVWYCKNCDEIILPREDELPVDPLQDKKKCSKCGKVAEGEKMVLDTWATSSLTPQIAEKLVDGKVQIPFSLRPQGHDIIRTWAFYTIVKSYLHSKEIPWKDIVISGNVSMGGEKMSKSKGNVINPQDIMDEFGSDALRFWAAGSKLGADMDYQEKDLVTGKKFINKLLNASKFVFMNLEDYDFKKPKKLEILDDLFLEKLNKLIKSATNSFEKYEYSKSKQEVEQFFLRDFCDNYLEIVKKRIYQGKGDEKKSAQYVLYKVLFEVLKMLAPIMPFITEEIYQEYFRKQENEKSVHLCSWPSFVNSEDDKNTFEILKNILTKVRQEKTKAQKPMNSEIILFLEKEDYDELVDVLDDLKNVTCANEIKVEKDFEVEFVD